MFPGANRSFSKCVYPMARKDDFDRSFWNGSGRDDMERAEPVVAEPRLLGIPADLMNYGRSAGKNGTGV